MPFNGPDEYICKMVDKIIELVQTGSRHPGYERAEEIRLWASAMMTGKGEVYKQYLHKFRRYEKDGLKLQRERLDVPLTPYVLARPRKYWAKMSSVENVNFRVTLEKAFEKVGPKILGQLDKFEGQESAFEWLVKALEKANSYDPNSWVIYERFTSPEGIEIVYPWVVGSSDVLDFKVRSGLVEWLFVKRDHQERVAGSDGKTVSVKLTDYYLYFAGGVEELAEWHEGVKEPEGAAVFTLQIEGKDQKFWSRSFKNKTTEVPAYWAGCYDDEECPGLGFVTWFEPARHILEDLIRHQNSLKTTEVLHAYARRSEYVRRCEYKGPEGSCEGRGYLDNNREKTCPSCGGAGEYTSPQSEQIVRKIKFPTHATAQDLIDLSKLSHTETLPTDYPMYLVDRIREDSDRVTDSCLSDRAARKDKSEKTAYEVSLDYTDLYDRLWPFGRVVSAHVELLHRVVAQYNSIKLEVVHNFRRDFRMKTVAEIEADLASARQSGAGYAVIKSLRLQLWAKMYEDNPAEAHREAVRYEWLPWDDKSETEVALIMAARSPLDPDRILRENWRKIFQMIEAETGQKFYGLKWAEQKAEIDKQVALVASQIKLV